MSPASNFPTDPLLRLLPSDPPASFMALPLPEQAWRGRVFLMTWAMGGEVAFSWAIAMRDEPVHNADLIDLVATVPDERIRDEVAARKAEDRVLARAGHLI